MSLPTFALKPASRTNSSQSQSAPVPVGTAAGDSLHSADVRGRSLSAAHTKGHRSRTIQVLDDDSPLSPGPESQHRQFKAAAAATLAFPTSTGGPRRHRRNLTEFLSNEAKNDSGTDDASSNPDDEDQAQLNFGKISKRLADSLSRSSSPRRSSASISRSPPQAPKPPASDVFDREGASIEMHLREMSNQEANIGMNGTHPARPAEAKLPPPFVLGRAIYDFQPNNAEEQGFLTFSKGDLICITGCFVHTSSWWYGKTAHKEGMFLAYHVERVEVEGEGKDPYWEPNQRPLSSVDVSSLETSYRISNFDGPAVFRRYDLLHLHILLDLQRRLRAYELTIEGLFTNPGRATNEEYRDIMASLEQTLKNYQEALLRYRDLQALENTSWSDADAWAHQVLPGLPKNEKSSVDAGDFVTPATSGDTFSGIARSLGLESWISRLILRYHGISIKSLNRKPLDARYRSSIIKTRSKMTRIMLAASGAVLLVTPVIAMYFVSQNWQLGIVCVATLITALLFSFTRTDATNIMIGTATIAAVLTVFLGQNGSGSGSLASSTSSPPS